MLLLVQKLVRDDYRCTLFDVGDTCATCTVTSFLAVKHFSEAFLLTYYTFITPEELITKLLYRYMYTVWSFITNLVWN